MIHYHGTPCTPQTAAVELLTGGHAFVSYARPDDLSVAIEVCQSFAIDNGAFSAWRAGTPVHDWSGCIFQGEALQDESNQHPTS